MLYIIKQAQLGFVEGWCLFWSPFTGFVKVARRIHADRSSKEHEFCRTRVAISKTKT